LKVLILIGVDYKKPQVITTVKRVKENKGWLENYVRSEKKKQGVKEGDKLKIGETRNKTQQRCANPSCNSNEAYFTTLQTRSADEGATLYCTCVKCGYFSHFSLSFKAFPTQIQLHDLQLIAWDLNQRFLDSSTPIFKSKLNENVYPESRMRFFCPF
jgi:DNA-directed RNA polymerase subunit M/transcription elongation factor TFIIS